MFRRSKVSNRDCTLFVCPRVGREFVKKQPGFGHRFFAVNQQGLHFPVILLISLLHNGQFSPFLRFSSKMKSN